MVKILHNKIPTNNGCPTLRHDEVQNIHDCVLCATKQLDEPYIVITTYTDLTCINDTDTVLTIDAKNYTYQELNEIIEKANMYDGLTK